MTKALMIALQACLAATIPACTDDLAAERKAVEAQYARLDVALNGKDPSPLEGLAAPDFRFVSVDGEEIDLGLWTRVWRQEMARFEALTVRSEVLSVAAEGDAVRAVVRVVMDGKGKEGSRVGKVRAEDTLHETWERLGPEWRLRRSTQVRRKAWDDTVLTEDVTPPGPLDPARRDAVVGELRARAIPFDTVTAGTGFDDLAALDRIIGDARIVALGEATHGTAEFFCMKHRLFEYLVEKKGFTVFAFETNWPAAEIADRYVKTGEGIAADALKAMHEIWQTREVRDLIEWMRTHNSVPGRARVLSFAGFDMQDPAAAVQCVTDAFDKLGASEAETIRRHYGGLHALNAARAKTSANVAEALKLLDARRAALLQVMTPKEYRRIRQCAAVVVQHSRLRAATGSVEFSNVRDEAMAENVKWLVEEAFPNEKIVLWAHNGHVAASPGGKAEVPMGRHLRRMFGEQMRILGFAFDRGEIGHTHMTRRGEDPGGATLVKVPPASPSSAEAVLRAAGLPRFILDLRTVPAAGPLGTWIAGPLRLRSMGTAEEPLDDPVSGYFMLASYGMLLLPKTFDALIFIEETTATVPLR
jgi:erythromycin esterase